MVHTQDILGEGATVPHNEHATEKRKLLSALHLNFKTFWRRVFPMLAVATWPFLWLEQNWELGNIS